MIIVEISDQNNQVVLLDSCPLRAIVGLHLVLEKVISIVSFACPLFKSIMDCYGNVFGILQFIYNNLIVSLKHGRHH